MIRIRWFEERGPWIAGMTGREDGDFQYYPNGDDDTRARLERVGIPAERLVRVRQVHGTGVWCLPKGALWEEEFGARGTGISADTTDSPDDPRPRADAIACAEESWTLGITVADCLPVWVGDPVVPCVALVHAGRLGSLAGIAEKTVRALMARYGAEPRRMVAAIGPGAGPCCYEVSPEMASALRAAGHPVRERKLDLPEVIRRSFVMSGIGPDRITISPICTICSGRFFSYRRGDRYARNLAVTALLKAV